MSYWSSLFKDLVLCLWDIMEHVATIAELDTNYLSWLVWLFTPVIVAFLLPALLVILLYASALFLNIYKHRHRLHEAYSTDVWEGARLFLCSLWETHGWIWHGYQIDGLEKIPDTGPAVLVFYHGAIPVDFYYIVCKIILYKRRPVKIIGDRFLFKVPGFKLLMEVFNVIPGSQETCTRLLKQGDLLGVAPGGVRESLFSEENYHLLWGRRVGFAKAALNSKAPVIPIFTMNVREAFRFPAIAKGILKRGYERWKIPVLPPYGNFPVLLKTFIGDPIPYDPRVAANYLALQAKAAIEDLIDSHQKLPGSIVRALFERIYYKPKCHHKQLAHTGDVDGVSASDSASLVDGTTQVVTTPLLSQSDGDDKDRNWERAQRDRICTERNGKALTFKKGD